MPERWALNRTSGPSEEPVTLAEAKDHCEIASSVGGHDTKLARYIAAARMQFEHATEYALITQAFRVTAQKFPAGTYLDEDAWIYLQRRPVISISSITYYDTGNTQQVLASTVYGLDKPNRIVHLKHDQEWPDITEQHNGVEINFTAGYGAAANVPDIFKQLILTQVARFFWSDRGDEYKAKGEITAYDRMIKPYLRATYP